MQIRKSIILVRYASLFCTHHHQAERAFAKHLRGRHTLGECVLWRKLRAKRFHGLKIRRQVPIGPYIVDFLCAERKLVIEVDGVSHYEPGAYLHDDKRDEYLRTHGFVIFRCGEYEAVTNTDAVLDRLAACLGFPSEFFL